MNNVYPLETTRLELPPLASRARVTSASEGETRAWFDEHDRHHQTAWYLDFHILDPIDTWMQPYFMDFQTVTSPAYRSEPRYRQFENHCYFCYTVSGRGGLATPRGVHEILPGQGFLMEIRDPGSWYFYPKDGCEPWRFLGFNFRGVESHVAVRGLVEKHGAVYTPPANSEAIQRLLMMESTGYRSVDMSAVDGSRMVFELLMLLAESVQIQNALDTAMNYLTRETLRLINTEAGSRFTVEALAHQLGVSREHLSRVFQSKIGRSLRDIIQLHRMRHACYLLKETKLPLKVIADRVGYANSANFSRSFQQFFQMTPSEFRTRGSRKALLSVQVPGE